MKTVKMICMVAIMSSLMLLTFAVRPASGAWSDQGLYMKTTDQGVVVDSTVKAYLNLDRGTKSEDCWLGFKSAGAYNWIIGTGRTGANSDLSFSSYAYNTWTTPLYLQYATGYIGIGTTNPSAKLEVIEDSWNDIVKIGVNGMNERLILSSGQHWAAISGGTTNRDDITIRHSSRYVGIGENAPSHKLDVNGSIRAAEQIYLSTVTVWDGTNDNDLTWNGSKITREGSSRSYKKNIDSLPVDEFHKVLNLEAVEYQWKKGYGEQGGYTTVGLIAEEVEDAGLNKLVIYNQEGEPEAVKYKKLAIYLLEIVKEHENRIEELEARLN